MSHRNGLVILCALFMMTAAIVPIMAGTAATEGRLGPGAIDFYGAGYNTSLVEQAPREAVVQKATMDVTGVMQPGATIEKTYDYGNTDSSSSKAYHGGDCFQPPYRPPSNRKVNEFSNTNYTQVGSADNSRAEHYYGLQSSCQCTGTYHYFEFVIDESFATKIDVTWDGWGAMYHFKSNSGGSTTMAWSYMSYLYIYNYTGATWHYLDNTTTASYADTELTGTLTSPTSHFIGPGNVVSVLAKSGTTTWMAGNETSELHSDYVKIVVTIDFTDSYPLYPSLDVGDDGDYQWQYSGEFKSTENINFTTELQSLIDAAGPGTTPVPVVFNFTSMSAGKLVLSNIDIVYLTEAPLWATIPDQSMEEDGDGVQLLDLHSFVSDDGPVESLAFEVVSNDNQANIAVSINADGHSLDVVPAQDYWGEANVVVSAEDGDNPPVTSRSFKITVTPVNDAPVIDPIDDQVMDEGETLSLTATATDVDKALDTDEKITFSDDTALFDINPYSGVIHYVANSDQVGLHFVNITASDGELSDIATFSIRVQNANDPPEIDPIPDQTAYEDQEYTYTVQAADPDEDFGDQLKYEDDSDLFEIGELSGEIAFTPVQEEVGEYEVEVTVTDASGVAVSRTFKLTVENTNDAPTLEPVPDATVNRKEVYEQVAVGDDVDLPYDPDELLTFSVVEGPVSINATTGQMTYTPARADAGTHTVTVKVADAAGESASATFKLTVVWVNSAPTASITTEDDKTKFKEGEVVNLVGEAADEDGDELNYTWMEGTEVLGYGPDIGLENMTLGEHNITLIVSDGDESASASIDIVVKKKPKGDSGLLPGFSTAAVVGTFSLLGALAFFRGRDRGRKV